MVYNAPVNVQAGLDEVNLDGLNGGLGTPRREAVTLRVSRLFSAVETRPDRVAEVVFAIRRPNGLLLLQTKSFYPAGVYRLPSGSVMAGEPVLAALRREVAEETSLQTDLLRWLAVITYDIVAPDGGKAERAAGTFTSYVFLLQETGGELFAADEDEDVAGFREIEARELPGVAAGLEALAESPDSTLRSWGDWGRFRAIVHRVVWDILQAEDGRAMAGPEIGRPRQ